MPASKLLGFDADHLIQRLTIEDLKLNGQKITSLEQGNIQMNEFVRNVVIQ